MRNKFQKPRKPYGTVKHAISPALRSRKGATMVEYGVLAGLIAVVSMTVVLSTGVEVKRIFTGIRTAQAPVVPPKILPPHGYDTDDTDAWLHGTPDADTLNMTASHIGVIGYASGDVMTGAVPGQIYISGPGDDFTTGVGQDIFVYMPGDGNDVFYSQTPSGVTSVLEFPEYLPEDLTFKHLGSGLRHLYIDTPSGEQIIVDSQWNDQSPIAGIKTMKFSSGLVFDDAEIRHKMIQDSQPTGVVYTTMLGDTIEHNAAEDNGYLVITNRGYGPLGYGPNILSLTDASESDLIISNNTAEDGYFKVKEDYIQVGSQFRDVEGFGIEKVIFQDGSELTYDVDGETLTGRFAIAAKMLDDMKATGLVYGHRYLDQKNVHKLGVDGDYTVYDYRNPGKNTLVLPGVTLSTFDVRNEGSGNWGYFDLPSGETIRVNKQFHSQKNYGYDTVVLDDAVLNINHLAQIIADKARNGGFIYGTNEDKIYTHYASDPVPRIFESRSYGFGGTLHFPDLNPNEVIINRQPTGNTVEIFLKNPDGSHGALAVWLSQQLQASGNGGVDAIQFADGSTIDHDQIRLRVDSDPYP